MENKKVYIEPEMEIVNLVGHAQPLCQCSENDDLCNGGFGYAPHEQDPIA